MAEVWRTGERLGGCITIADTSWRRLRGLLGSPGLACGSGLLLCDCRAVHLFFMRHALDLVFLDRAGRIVGLRPQLRPWRMALCPAARHTLELGPGTIAAWRLELGQSVQIVHAPPASTGHDV